MTYEIGDNCATCGACAAQCPAGAIDFNDELGHYKIDQEKCMHCGGCFNTCPMGAISQK